MEPEGTLVDPSDQIFHAMDLLSFTVSHWWQVKVQVGTRRSCIPPIKVCKWSLELGFSGQDRCCSVLLCLPAVLPWREKKAAMVKALSNSFNKAPIRSSCGLIFAGQGSKLLHSRHGDVEVRKFLIFGYLTTGQCQGSYEVSLGRASAEALSWPRPLMAKGDPCIACHCWSTHVHNGRIREYL
jgi:hypothetical protein